MMNNKMNLDHFWTKVDLKLQWIEKNTGGNKSIKQQILEKVFENDQKLYRKPNKTNSRGFLRQKDNFVLSNVEMNVHMAINNLLDNDKGRSQG